MIVEPTPGRVLQHTLFTRAHPTPEQLSTLLARLTALMGQDRIGAPATVDTDRPGAFAMTPFATEHKERFQPSAIGRQPLLASALRRCRQPVPARVSVGADGHPSRLTTDRRGFAGGVIVACAGPWRTSGNWWAGPERAGQAGTAGQAGLPLVQPAWDRDEWDVSLNDGAVYRVFRDRASDGWFIDAIVD